VKGKLLQLRRTRGAADEMSDEALLAACAVGEAAALGALFDRHRRTIHRFVARLVNNDRDVEDVVQQTFLEVHRSARKFGGRSTAKTWMLGIAANMVRHHVRSDLRRRAATERFGAELRPVATDLDRQLEQRDLVARLEAAIATLSNEQRVVFVMCDLEEVPGRDAAEILGVREGTLWWRLSEARRTLRAALEVPR
jgi:RNA polymerase sigma-70 factor (ECF subfamily)